MGERISCGGGDRYVTVWENENGEWRIRTRLGIHTGWVKELALLSPFAFSIGCNHVEIWEDEQHVGTLRVESSKKGSTLSGDLLCLATRGMEDSAILFAGGVDGRIHKWKARGSFDFLGAVCAHRGRVNKLLACERLDALVSVGNDGMVQCRDISEGSLFETQAVATANLKELEWNAEKDKIHRAIALCIVKEDSNAATLAIGTTSGVILLVNLHRSKNVLHFKILDEYVVKLEDSSTIHALDCFHDNNIDDCGKYRITVGHSNGLSIWDILLH